MKYKYSRKKLVKIITAISYLQISDIARSVIVNDLLALADKPCKHDWKLTPDTWGETCHLCGEERRISTSPKTKPEIEKLGDVGEWTVFGIGVKLNEIIDYLSTKDKKEGE
jgi:hypothetical protein